MGTPTNSRGKVKPVMKDASTQTGPNPRPTIESWDEFHARLGLDVNKTAVEIVDEAAKYDTSVTVVRDYIARLEVEKKVRVRKAARARVKEEKEKEKKKEKEKEEENTEAKATVEADVSAMKNEPTNENLGLNNVAADVGGASKESITLNGDNGKTTHVQRPRNLFSKLGFSFKRRMFWRHNKGA
jgi:hypothetical protein